MQFYILLFVLNLREFNTLYGTLKIYLQILCYSSHREVVPMSPPLESIMTY